MNSKKCFVNLVSIGTKSKGTKSRTVEATLKFTSPTKGPRQAEQLASYHEIVINLFTSLPVFSLQSTRSRWKSPARSWWMSLRRRDLRERLDLKVSRERRKWSLLPKYSFVLGIMPTGCFSKQLDRAACFNSCAAEVMSGKQPFKPRCRLARNDKIETPALPLKKRDLEAAYGPRRLQRAQR